MAVYERTYRRYTGPLTPSWSRFLILPRYAYQEVFKSRLFLSFFVLCFVAPVVGLVLLYLRHNVSALAFFQVSQAQIQEALPINGEFFLTGLRIQGMLCFLLTLTVAPALVAPDLRNNGLPLYLSRPFSRAEYVLGKMTVLVALLSAITWIPGLLLFAFQSYLEGWGWFSKNAALAGSIFLGSWVWILVLSLVGLAVSAWVKWKPIARVALLAVFFVLSGFAEAFNAALNTWWGSLLSVWRLIDVVWDSLFGQQPEFAMPLWAAWMMIAAFCLVCLWMLSKRLQAYEVVR